MNQIKLCWRHYIVDNLQLSEEREKKSFLNFENQKLHEYKAYMRRGVNWRL